MEISNKQKAVALLKSIETGDRVPISYINPTKYIVHNPWVGDGIDGFTDLLTEFPPNFVKVNTVRCFQDGDFVFTHSHGDFLGPVIGFDIFRFEDGKIVEHWDNMEENANPNPSNHAKSEHVTVIKDLDKTEENKTVVRSFVNDILVNDKLDKLMTYFDGDNYVQHSPNISAQLTGLAATFTALGELGIFVKYDKIHKVLGEGNFVLVVSEGRFGKEYNAFYDLFRVENDKIAERWEVRQPIPTKEYWKNNNGKF